MSKFRQIKSSFLGGQLSQNALARTDLALYNHSCELLKNMIPFLSGGAYRRPGTVYVNGVGPGSYLVAPAPRLIPFVISKTEAYCIAIYPKIGTAPGFIETYRVSNNFTNPTMGTVTHTAAVPWQSANSTNGFQYDETSEIQFIQSADVMWLVHPNRPPMRLSRTALDTFTLNFYYVIAGADTTIYPFQDQNTTGTTLTINTATVGTGRTLTASAAIFTASKNWVGSLFKIADAGTTGVCEVTAWVDTTHVTVTVHVAFPDTAAHTTWWESAISFARGWPRSVSLYQGRLALGGSESFPDSIWFSQTSNYKIFSTLAVVYPTSTASGTQPFTAILQSLYLNQIQWMTRGDENVLTVGTLGEEWSIGFIPTTTLDFARETIKYSLQSSYGSAYIQPVRVREELFFCPGKGDEIRGLIFSNDDQTFVAENLQTTFDEFPKIERGFYNRKYRNIAWDATRSTLWACDSAGNWFGLTRDRLLQIAAWHTHEMGGYNAYTGSVVTTTDTPDVVKDPIHFAPDGTVNSIAVVPNTTLGTNDVWFSVRRHVDGSWRYFVERMYGKHIENETAYVSATPLNPMVDSAGLDLYLGDGVDMQSIAIQHLLNLSNIEATAFSAYGLFKVTGVYATAVLTLDTSGLPPHIANVWMGLHFSSVIKTVRLEAGSVVGSSQAAVKRIHDLFIRFYRTLSAKAGRDANNLETIIFRLGSTPMGYSPELFNGDKHLKFSGDYDRDGYVYIIQDAPLPFAVCGITAEGVTYDG